MLRTLQSLTGNNAKTAFNLNLSALIRLHPEFVYLLPLQTQVILLLFLRTYITQPPATYPKMSITTHQPSRWPLTPMTCLVVFFCIFSITNVFAFFCPYFSPSLLLPSWPPAAGSLISDWSCLRFPPVKRSFYCHCCLIDGQSFNFWKVLWGVLIVTNTI